MGILESVISRDQELTGEGRWLKGTVNSSLVVDSEKQIFFWNSRGIVGDVYVYLTKIKGLTHDQSKEFLRRIDGFEGSFIYSIKDKTEVIVYPKLVDVFYENGLLVNNEYWDRRGINLDTRLKFKLGYYNGFVTVPIYQDGLFKNFQLRSDNPKTVRQYYKQQGSFLFNSDILKLTDEIIITESPTDCLRLSQEGIPCVSSTSGAEGWSQSWFSYFMRQKKIIVLYDNDNAGRIGARKVAENLGIYKTRIYTFDGFDQKYDVVDFFNDRYCVESLLSLIKDNAKYTFELPEIKRWQKRKG